MTGLFGGTFNPIHVGHLQAARDVAAALDLDRVVFIPNANPPHKDGAALSPEARLAPASLRLDWIEAAIADDPRFETSRCELDREGPSYLVDTLAELTGGRAAEFVFIVGQDAFRELGTWRAPRELLAACCWAVCTRPPLLDGHLADWLPEPERGDFEIAADGRSARHRTAGTWIRLIEITPVDVSASALRAALARGDDAGPGLPASIRNAVHESRCYTHPAPEAGRGAGASAQDTPR